MPINNLRQFAEKHTLRVRRCCEDDTENVVGKFGEIYEYAPGLFGVMVIPPRRKGNGLYTMTPCRGLWVRCRAQFMKAGMTVTQDGDQEGAATFDPTNAEQATVAIQAIRAKRRRKLSPEHRAKLLAASRSARLRASGPVLNGPSAVQERTEGNR